ncbi:PAS domain-containing protein [Ideonella sp. A 288]|uniref:PAS domain-containing protein n=1 Tax=Ideonella sp. A 288 TaxID=1962181 RepID=UPI001186DB04|nr:PAS domain-containing protein [Ideonella sp. A 288]
MSPPPSASTATVPPVGHGVALRIALAYAALGALWILGSDWLLGRLVTDPGWLVRLGAVKGWAYVGLTAAALYAVIRRLNARAPAASRPDRTLQPPDARLMWRAWWPWAALISTLTVVALAYSLQAQRVQHEARLVAVSDLRAREIGDWVQERLSHARFASTSTLWAGYYLRWRDQGDAATMVQMMARLTDMRTAFGDHSGRILDEHGNVVADETEGRRGQPTPAPLKEAALRAMATGTVQHTSLYTLPGEAHEVAFEVIAPLVHTGRPARAAVALRVDPNFFSPSTLSAWPVPTRSASAGLVLREGDMIMGMQRRNPLPLSSPNLLAARALRGEAPMEQPIDGVDYRGVPSVGVVHAVPGTDWHVVARIDRREILEDALGDMAWILAAGLLALFGSGVSVYLRTEQAAVKRLLDDQDRQREQLRGLSMMQAIADSSPDAIVAKDRDGRYLLCNEQACHLIGLPMAAVLGRDDQSLGLAERRPNDRRDELLAMAENRFLTVEEELVTPDGRKTLLTVKGPLRDPDGQVIGSFGVARDITDRKQAEVVARELTMQVQAVEDSVLDQMAVLDASGRIIDVNAAWRQFARDNSPPGVEPQAGTDIGVNYLEVCRSARDHGDATAKEVFDGLSRVLDRRSELFSLEYRCDSPAEARWYQMNVTPLRTASGGAVVVHSNVTQRRGAEAEIERHRNHLQQLVDERTQQLQALNAALVERERFVRTVADNQPGMLAYWGVDLRCRFANRAYREWFGRSEAEMDGIALDELLSGERLAYNKRLVEAMMRGERQHYQSVQRAMDGRVMHGLATLVPDMVDGQVVGGLVLISDITEVKQGELELQRLNDELTLSRDRAEAANRAKSAFLANMSHEIRTPLNAILGLTHLLRRDSHDQRESERLGKVTDAATHLLEVISDVLDLSKIESGRLELEQVDFSLSQLVSRALSLVAERAQAKGLALTADVVGLPDALQGDPTRLSQALLNLLTNAVKFTDQGSILLHCEALQSDGDALLARFTVRDTGVGIPADKVGTLFDTFVQADPSTTRRFGGTGLGLAITRRLAELMDGEVGVRSVPGQGSEFWFTARLQLGTGHDEAAAAAASIAPDTEAMLRQFHAGARILVAEDNPVNQEVAVELLQSVGMVVDVADNGAEAIARARQGHYDLVLMDVQMPVMDGLQAAQALRTLPETADVPIVAMTADAFGESRQACLAAGMNGHVSKPVDPALLYEALRRWLPTRGLTPAPAPSAAAPTAEARQAGASIPGLDMVQALQYLGGRTDVYQRVLRQFAQHYGESIDEVSQGLESGDSAHARAMAHSIRGAAASIGAQALAALAGNLETALADAGSDDDLRPAGRVLAQALRATVSAIEDNLAPEAPVATAPADADALVASLDELERLLAVGDYQSVALHRDLADGLRKFAGPEAAEIGARLRRFDFDGALAALRALRTRYSD